MNTALSACWKARDTLIVTGLATAGTWFASQCLIHSGWEVLDPRTYIAAFSAAAIPLAIAKRQLASYNEPSARLLAGLVTVGGVVYGANFIFKNLFEIALVGVAAAITCKVARECLDPMTKEEESVPSEISSNHV